VGERFRNRIDALEERFFVGREQETAKFARLLHGEMEDVRILNIYGTGGMGKSTLLSRFERMAQDAGALFLTLDSRDFHHSPDDLGGALHSRLAALAASDGGAGTSVEEGIAYAVWRLNEEANRRKVLLAFDTFEEFGDLEHWLRETFLPMLDVRIALVLAGRHSLRGNWVTSPAWRQVTLRMPLGQLREEEARAYLRRQGFDDPAVVASILLRAQGHPLSLSLAAYYYRIRNDGFAAESGFAADSELSLSLAEVWLREVPEPLRELTEAAAALRSFNQETLSAALDRQVDAAEFERLAALSFVRTTQRGWMVHDLVREAVARQLRLRSPELYQRLLGRIVRYYYQRIVESKRKAAMAWEMSEIVGYLGSSIMRAYMNKHLTYASYYLEPLSAANIAEANVYKERWGAQAGLHRERWVDPESGEEIDLSFHLGQEAPVIRSIDFEELLTLEPDAVRLYRDAAGDIAGFYVIVPIHEGTFDYLRSRPYSRAYFESRTPEQAAALRTPRSQPAGWFIRGVNVARQGDPQGTFTSFQALFSLLLRGGLLVVSPPPVPLFQGVYRGLGFDEVPDLYHRDYDGRTPTPTFVLDTRGPRLGAYLRRLVSDLAPAPGESAAAAPAAPQLPGLLGQLSARELEVVDLVAEGLTNPEIAERLFVSEVTVKKHLTSVFQKTGLKNRGALIKAIAAGGRPPEPE